jgi:uncharacterized OsmC-like protein
VEAGLHPATGGTGMAVGFQRIRLQFDLDTDATEEQLASLLKLTERYCVVAQTLQQSPELTIAHQRSGVEP